VLTLVLLVLSNCNIGSLLGSDADALRASIQSCLDTNLFGVLNCCRVAAERMSVQRGGSGGAIVNVSSGSALMGSPMPYGVSKGALNSLQAGLVKELAAHGIRVNAVSPGMTKTDMLPADVRAYYAFRAESQHMLDCTRMCACHASFGCVHSLACIATT